MIGSEWAEPRSRGGWSSSGWFSSGWFLGGWSRGGWSLAVSALGVWVTLAGCRIEPTNGRGAPASVEPSLLAQVDEILATQAAAWNRGDLDAFMSAYDRSPTTSFIGGAGVLEGYDAIRANYAPGFEPGAARDVLRFDQLRAPARSIIKIPMRLV